MKRKTFVKADDSFKVNPLLPRRDNQGNNNRGTKRGRDNDAGNGEKYNKRKATETVENLERTMNFLMLNALSVTKKVIWQANVPRTKKVYTLMVVAVLFVNKSITWPRIVLLPRKQQAQQPWV
ncbi:uncharacterized protein B0P05DRAFT_575256 [Gilbertella persicaria]|uniref:uncharacterized protein n=1 Tax=Gilbertella persicaria TaxID=101096 RepID=UPI00222048E4|nr:uncharacterized protein B0P05DRAFT_575256 [Gilbertella persicaria]KAI8056307.1 hypothetical protein B0P05DRAFT_575256 [Gilbertella persicaria]